MGFWIDNRIYWTFDTPQDYILHFIVTHTSVRNNVFTALAWLRHPTADFPFLVQELSPDSTISSSEQQLTTSEL
jgi:hypothetical protein